MAPIILLRFHFFKKHFYSRAKQVFLLLFKHYVRLMRQTPTIQAFSLKFCTSYKPLTTCQSHPDTKLSSWWFGKVLVEIKKIVLITVIKTAEAHWESITDLWPVELNLSQIKKRTELPTLSNDLGWSAVWRLMPRHSKRFLLDCSLLNYLVPEHKDQIEQLKVLKHCAIETWKGNN